MILLRAALLGTVSKISRLSDEEYDRLMRQAQSHGMEALVGEALIKGQVQLSRTRVAHLMGVIRLTEQRNIQVNRQLTDITECLEHSGISYFVVKGQVLGTYYPSPLLRRSGDIDIFLPERYDAAVDRLSRLPSMTCRRGYEKGKHLVMERGGVVFELHHKLLLLATPRHRRAWQSFVSAMQKEETFVIINGCKVCTLPLYGHLVYVFMHLYFHLITSGVGLRQLCDMAILLQRCADETVDWERILSVVHSLGCSAAFRAVVACCVDELCVSSPIPLSRRDHCWGNRVFRNILRAGNFGCARRVVRKAGWLHRIETAVMTLHNSLTFLRLAPLETLLRGKLIIDN